MRGSPSYSHQPGVNENKYGHVLEKSRSCWVVEANDNDNN